MKEDIDNADVVMLSVVTVCLNAEKDIPRAIESVLNQDYKEFEYIVIDGKSTDNTNEIINKYKEEFKKKDIDFRHYSDNDKGIYDAMNKGILLSKGKWITFLNSDDYYYDAKVLSRVFGGSEDEYDFIYGGSVNWLGNNHYYRAAKEPETLYYRMPFVHQAAFIRSSVISNYRFDLKYHYAADFEQFVSIYLDGCRLKILDYPIVQFNLQGMSGKNITSVMREHELIRIRHGIFCKKIAYRYIRYLGMIGMRSIKTFYVAYIKVMKIFTR